MSLKKSIFSLEERIARQKRSMIQQRQKGRFIEMVDWEKGVSLLPKSKKRTFKKNEHGFCDAEHLVYAPWNPVARIDSSDKKFQKLCKSIKDLGQLLPVIITEHGLVLDGNRRTAACAVLNKPVEFMVKGGFNPFKAYAAMNNERMVIQGNQKIALYLSEPRCLNIKDRSMLASIEKELGGRETLEKLQRFGCSYAELIHAQQWVRWNKSWGIPMATIAQWISTHKMKATLMIWRQLELPLEDVKNAIIRNVPLRKIKTKVVVV